MIAVDTNILVYSVRADSPWHAQAREAIRGLAEGDEPWAIAWPCIHEFVGVVTHPRIYKPPTSLADALLQVEYWCAVPGRRLRLLADVRCSCNRRESCGAGRSRRSRGRHLHRWRRPRNLDQRSRLLPVPQNPCPESARSVSVSATIELIAVHSNTLNHSVRADFPGLFAL